jgi:hypothetical protein
MMKNLRFQFNLKKAMCFLFLLPFVFLFTQTYAQENNQESSGSSGLDLRFGGKFGTTLSSFTNQQPYTNQAQGLTAGGFVRYGLTDALTVQLEVNYFQQGGRLTNFDVPSMYGSIDWYDMEVSNQYLRMHNIEVPLLAQYTLTFNKLSVVGQLGPSFGYNVHSGVISDQTAFNTGAYPRNYSDEKNVTSKINALQYSITAGISIEYPLIKDIALSLEGRYRYGLNSVYDGYSYLSIPQVQGDLQNHSTYFSIGFIYK